MDDLKISTSVLKDTPNFCSYRTDAAENETQSLILAVATLQHKLNSQPYRMWAIRVRELTEKKWDPEI